MAESDQFRIKSLPFKDIPWSTDILSAPGGLQQLESVPGLSVCQFMSSYLLLPDVPQGVLAPNL